MLIGETKGHLGQSIFLRETQGREEGSPPPVDLEIEKRNGDFVRALIETGRVTAVHDCSDGGLAVTLAEMAMAGGIGVSITLDPALPAHAFLFGEDQARYVVTCNAGLADAIAIDAENAGISITRLGSTGGNALTFSDAGSAAIPN